MIEYIKTDDPNIVKKTVSTDEYVRIDEVRARIKNIESLIANIPKPKTVPDQETLDQWNMCMCYTGEHEMLEVELKEAHELLNNATKTIMK